MVSGMIILHGRGKMTHASQMRFAFAGAEVHPRMAERLRVPSAIRAYRVHVFILSLSLPLDLGLSQPLRLRRFVRTCKCPDVGYARVRSGALLFFCASNEATVA